MRVRISSVTVVLQFLAWGQRFSAEVHAGGNPGFEPPKMNPCVNGRHRLAAQSTPAGVD
jgi:hypothetical protein